VYESVAASNLMRVWEYSGAWNQAERLGVDLLEGAPERPGAEYLHLELTLLAAARGDLATAREHFRGMAAWRHIESNEARWTYTACDATIALAAGDAAGALQLLSATIGEVISAEGVSSQASRIGFPCAIEAAFALGRIDEAERLLSLVAGEPLGHVAPFLRSQLARGFGLLAVARGDGSVAVEHFGVAIDTLGALGFPYWLACARIDLAGVLVDAARVDEARSLLEEATTTLTELGARPALARAEALMSGLPVAAGR
jgi:hypothetical protein